MSDEKAPAVALKTATIARGRSLMIDGRIVGAGERVSLPESDVARLRASGFLVDPAAKPVKEANGPTFERR